MLFDNRDKELAMETIAFQHDEKFKTKFEDLVSQIFDEFTNSGSVKKAELTKKYSPLLGDLIFNRLGIKVNVDFINDGSCNAYIYPLILSNQHTLLHKQWRGSELPRNLEEFSKKNKDEKGTVDLKNSRVSGLFSKFNHYLGIDIETFYQIGMSVREVVGILMHELGHAFTYYEFADRIETTNKILSELSDRLKDKDFDMKEIEYILKDLDNKSLLTKEDVAELLTDKKKVIFSSKLAVKVFNTVLSQHNLGRYDDTSSEQLADSFASRWGYFSDLTTGLHKLHKANGSPDTSRLMWFIYMIFEFIAFVQFSFMIGYYSAALVELFIGTAITSTLIPMALGSMLLLFIVYMLTSGDGNRDMTYDDSIYRYKRLRQEAINVLKNKNLPKELIESTLEGIETMDVVIDGTLEFKGLFNSLANIMNPYAIKAKNQIRLQQVLEKIANNDLFVQSAKFGLASQ